MSGNRIFKLKGKRNEIIQFLFSNSANARAVYNRELSPRYEEDIERAKFLSEKEGDDIAWLARFFNNLHPRLNYAQGDINGTSLKAGLDIVWNEFLNSSLIDQKKLDEFSFCYRNGEEINADSIFFNEASKDQWAILHVEKQLSDNENMEIFFSEAFLNEIFGKNFLNTRPIPSNFSLEFSEVYNLKSYSGKNIFKDSIENNEFTNIPDSNNHEVDGKIILKNFYLYKFVDNNFSEIEKFPSLKEKVFSIKEKIFLKLSQEAIINDEIFSLYERIVKDVKKIVEIEKLIENFSDENKTLIEKNLNECIGEILKKGWPKSDDDILNKVNRNFQGKILKFGEIVNNILKVISEKSIFKKKLFKEIGNFLGDIIINNEINSSSFDSDYCSYIRHFSLDLNREKLYAKDFFQKIFLSEIPTDKKFNAIKYAANSIPIYFPAKESEKKDVLDSLSNLFNLLKETALKGDCFEYINAVLKNKNSILSALVNSKELNGEEFSLIIQLIKILSSMGSDSTDVNFIISCIDTLKRNQGSNKVSWYEFLVILKNDPNLRLIQDFENSVNNIVTNITNSKISELKGLLDKKDAGTNVKENGSEFVKVLRERFDKKANDTGELLLCLDKATEMLKVQEAGKGLSEAVAAFKESVSLTKSEKITLASIAFTAAVITAGVVALGALILMGVLTFGLGPATAAIVGSVVIGGGGAVSISAGFFAYEKKYQGTLYSKAMKFAKAVESQDEKNDENGQHQERV